ncbi:hypothetical protein SprV_0100288200 [Sparganum proliferum]
MRSLVGNMAFDGGLPFVYAYVDGVLVTSQDADEHLQHFALVFDQFQQFRAILYPTKFVLGVTSFEFLGHQIESNGIRPLPSKVSAIRDFQLPASKRQLQRFPGEVNFYYQFLPNRADTILPLTGLLAGYTLIRTTAYHPAAIGTVERFYRQLKTSLCAADDAEDWTDHLPLVLLGIRSALRPGPDCSAAELVLSATVQLPGKMLSPISRGAVEDPTNILHRLRQFIWTFSLVPHRSSASPKRTWQRALTSTFEVRESAGLWNRPLTARPGCSLAGRRLSAFNATVVKRS